MSENQKWKECGEVFQVAQNILSKCGMGQYQSRLACVKQLISLFGEFSELNGEVNTIDEDKDEEEDSSGTVQNENHEEEDSSRTVQNENPEEEDSSRTVQHENHEDQEHHVQSLFELTDLTRTPDHLPNLMGSQTDQQQDETSTSELLGVKFAPVTKKRGRPKGSCTTAIGLPQKRRKVKDSSVPYHKKSMITKELYVLGLFMDTTLYTKGELLGEHSVECMPESLPSALLDEHLDINIIRKFFDQDGWVAVSTK